MEKMKMEKYGKVYGVLLLLLLSCMVMVSGEGEGDNRIAAECGSVLTKVTACLSFASAKAETPTKDCCTAVTDIKHNNPVCLCFIIQQIHSGANSQLKSMGIQEARLLQLPSACKLANASVAECPKLLNLPANSPDSAIFTNPLPSTPTTPASPAGTASPTTASGSSDGFKQVPHLAAPMALALPIFFSAFPSGFWF